MPAEPFRYEGPVLADYASRSEASRGRFHPEPEAPERSPFQRDRTRIGRSGAFRKLRNKTQVFMYQVGDYFRTRLTHSLEVAQIARTLCRSLGLNEDLAEAVALAHDCGHAPFGHAGEIALDSAMLAYGGFDHNDQTVRIMTSLERRYAAFDGLNLTWETLEGIVKHNGPIRDVPSQVVAGLDRQMTLDLAGFASAEAQVASLADDIAYGAHDLDDGLRAGLFGLDDLIDVPRVGPIVADIRREHGGIADGRVAHEVYRRQIEVLCADLLAESRRRLATVHSVDAVRSASEPVVGFSVAVAEQDREFKVFLFNRMYRHDRVNRMAAKGRRVVSDVFHALLDEPRLLPEAWQIEDKLATPVHRARLVADYVAGMTDRYVVVEHKRLFDTEATS